MPIMKFNFSSRSTGVDINYCSSIVNLTFEKKSGLTSVLLFSKTRYTFLCRGNMILFTTRKADNIIISKF